MWTATTQQDTATAHHDVAIAHNTALSSEKPVKCTL